MAKQVITVRVSQQNSGNTLRIRCDYTSDGVIVRAFTSSITNRGGATLDTGLSERVRCAVVQIVRDWERQELLW